MAQNSNLLSINNILQHVTPSIMIYHNNRLPLPEVHKKSHATTRCRTSSLQKQSRNSTLPHQLYNQVQDVALARGICKSQATTRCLHQWHPQKLLRNNALPSPAENEKTITQQHVAFTSDTRKNSHSTTRHPHQWKTQNKTRNNTLPSPVVHAKQSRNNTLPSPVVHAK